MAAGRSSPETVSSSHPFKLEQIHAARAAGYTVVPPVVLIPEELAVAGVAYRLRAGGHPVAENKIRQRHHRLWTLSPMPSPGVTRPRSRTTAASRASPRGKMSEGFMVGSPTWPDWTPAVLQTRSPA